MSAITPDHRRDVPHEERKFRAEGLRWRVIGGRRFRVEPGLEPDRQHVEPGEDQPRDDAGDQERADVDLRQQHRERRGRDDDGEAACPEDRADGHVFLVASRRFRSGRTSASTPSTAAAAAMAGDIRCARGPRPCRPRKLRGGGGAAPAGRNRVPVHRDAHRTARGDPLGTGLDQDPVQPLLLGPRLHDHRAGRDDARNLRAPPCKNRRCGAQILDPSVRAGADEDLVDGRAGERPAGREPRVVERIAHRAPALRFRGPARRFRGRARLPLSAPRPRARRPR